LLVFIATARGCFLFLPASRPWFPDFFTIFVDREIGLNSLISSLLHKQHMNEKLTAGSQFALVNINICKETQKMVARPGFSSVSWKKRIRARHLNFFFNGSLKLTHTYRLRECWKWRC
jgi:hypothetical protein